MIGYTSVGTNDFDAATRFYDELLGSIGAGRFLENDRFVAWSTGPGAPGFSVCRPFDEKPASVGNGVMIALAVDSRDKVDALYAKALELGGTDEGAPGQRMDNFYAGYFRDLDGNKLNAFYFGE